MNTTSIPIPPLEPQRGSSLVGKAYWVMLQRVTLIAAAIDVGYILLFMGLGSRPLAIVNFLSIAMYLGAYRLIQKRYNAAALVLIWVEVLGHAALGSLLIGWDSGFHYYLLLFIPAIVVANTRGYAAPMVLALLAYYLGLQALCSHWGPLDPLPVRSVQIVNWMHICLVFAMSAALAAVYRRTILIAGSRLRKQATQDPLTSLANRSHFEALAAHALARSQRDPRAGLRQRAAVGGVTGLQPLGVPELGNRLAAAFEERGVEIARDDLAEQAREAGGHAADAAADLHHRLLGGVGRQQIEGLEVRHGLVVAGVDELGQVELAARDVVEHPAGFAHHIVGRVLALGGGTGGLPWHVLSTTGHQLVTCVRATAPNRPDRSRARRRCARRERPAPGRWRR